MIRANVGERFMIVVALWDEAVGINASGRTVYYDIRDENDNPLFPPINGTLIESTVASGIYKKILSIDVPGEYVCYAVCDDFYSSTEEIIINQENIYDEVKASRAYNLKVEDVVRDSTVPTASQLVRNVPLGSTDYIITYIKNDDDLDWSYPTASGVSFAWYKTINSEMPFKMGDSGV